jgi:hypothetical protein
MGGKSFAHAGLLQSAQSKFDIRKVLTAAPVTIATFCSGAMMKMKQN